MRLYIKRKIKTKINAQRSTLLNYTYDKLIQKMNNIKDLKQQTRGFCGGLREICQEDLVLE